MHPSYYTTSNTRYSPSQPIVSSNVLLRINNHPAFWRRWILWAIECSSSIVLLSQDDDDDVSMVVIAMVLKSLSLSLSLPLSYYSHLCRIFSKSWNSGPAKLLSCLSNFFFRSWMMKSTIRKIAIKKRRVCEKYCVSLLIKITMIEKKYTAHSTITFERERRQANFLSSSPCDNGQW